MKSIYTCLTSIAVLFCVHVSQANISYYVRNDTLVPLMVGLYSIDGNGRVINPDNYTYLLAPQSLASQGQSAHLTSLTSPHEVGKRFIFSQSPNDMVNKVVYDSDHPWVFVRPITTDENEAIQRYYHIYADIFSHEAQGHNLIIEPLEHPIVGNQSKLKFNLRKEDDVRKLNQAIRNVITQRKEAARKIKEEQKKVAAEIQKYLAQKVEITAARNKLQEFLRKLKRKVRELRQPKQPVAVAPQPSPAVSQGIPQEPSHAPLMYQQEEPSETSPEVVIHQQEQPQLPTPVVVVHSPLELPIPIAQRVEPLDPEFVRDPEVQNIVGAAQAFLERNQEQAEQPVNAPTLSKLVARAENLERALNRQQMALEGEHRERRESLVRDRRASLAKGKNVPGAYYVPEDPEAIRKQKEIEAKQKKEAELDVEIDDFMMGRVPLEGFEGFENLEQR